MRIGRAPKRLLVYRTETPFKGFKLSPIEMLCEGQQFVAFTSTPTPAGLTNGRRTRSPTSTSAGCRRSRGAARAFAEEAYALAGEPAAGAACVANALTASGSARRASWHADAITAALAFIPNADLDYDSWMRIGMALKGALGDEGESLFSIWSAQSAKDVPDTPPRPGPASATVIGAGTIYHHAMANGWSPDPALVLNGSIEVNGRHPAKALLEKLGLAEPVPVASR